jgi:Leucine-rich repeat (LRR) protein
MKLTPAYIGGIAGQDVRTVEKLDLSKKEIKEMDDISCCVELKRLDLSQNQLSKVYGINFLKEITWLNLSSNKLTSIVGLQMMTKLNGFLFPLSAFST